MERSFEKNPCERTAREKSFQEVDSKNMNSVLSGSLNGRDIILLPFTFSVIVTLS